MWLCKGKIFVQDRSAIAFVLAINLQQHSSAVLRIYLCAKMLFGSSTLHGHHSKEGVFRKFSKEQRACQRKGLLDFTLYIFKQCN